MTIVDTLKGHGMERVHGVRTPIGAEWNELQASEGECCLP